MQNILKDYFQFSLRPFKTHQKMADSFENTGESRSLKIEEIIVTSWAFEIIHAIYSMISILLGLKTYQYFSESDDYSAYIQDLIPEVIFNYKVLSLLFVTMLFPFVASLIVKIGIFIVKLFVDFLGLDVAQEEIDESVTHSLCANIFLIIPVFGYLFKFIFQAVYLYAGFRVRLHMSKIQALILLISPFFIITTLLFLYILINAIIIFG